MYEPEKLKLWTMPDNYTGTVWPGYYVVSCGQMRDSTALDRSNFTCALQAIKRASDFKAADKTIVVVRERHYLVGWIEWIAIHQDDEGALKAADAIAVALDDYPVLDEDHYSDVEYEERCDYWNGLTAKEKVEIALEGRDCDSIPVWMVGRQQYHELDASHVEMIGEELRMICNQS